MPQMAPMNWVMILISISLNLMILNSLNYFSILYIPSSNKKSKTIYKNWLW